MMRWFAKRWVLAGVFGTTAALGLALAQAGKDAPSGPPKVGDVITLPFQNGATKQVKVIKVDKQPDGSYLSEVKDTKTGETFTLYDGPTEPGKAPAKSGGSSKDKDANLPKAKPRQSDPLLPSTTTPMPETPKDQESKDKGLKLFGDRSKPNTADTPPAEPQKRPGLIGRIFGRKSSTPSTSMPAATSTSGKPAMPAPGANMSAPPTVRPTPNLTPPNTSTTPLVPAPGGTGEPPRVPLKPTTPASTKTPPLVPAPTTPAPLPIPVPPSTPAAPTSPTIPAAPPVLPSAPPAALPTNPPPVALPSTPPAALPTTPPPAGAPGGLPPIPLPPGSVSTAPPAVVPAATPVSPPPVSPVMPAAVPAPAPVTAPTATVPAMPAVMPEIQPQVTALQTALAPSERIMAAQSLAGGRHGSTDAVKAVIFRACTDDPCALVRACCIDELCKLGYRDPAFLTYLKKACDDPSDDVRLSAKAAVAKLGVGK